MGVRPRSTAGRDQHVNGGESATGVFSADQDSVGAPSNRNAFSRFGAYGDRLLFVIFHDVCFKYVTNLGRLAAEKYLDQTVNQSDQTNRATQPTDLVIPPGTGMTNKATINRPSFYSALFHGKIRTRTQNYLDCSARRIRLFFRLFALFTLLQKDHLCRVISQPQTP
jgi:hypothetical protein